MRLFQIFLKGASMRQEVKMTGQNQGRTITPANEVIWVLHWDLQLWYASAGIWVPLSHVYYSTCYLVSLSESVVLRLILVRAGKCPLPCIFHSSELSSTCGVCGRGKETDVIIFSPSYIWQGESPPLLWFWKKCKKNVHGCESCRRQPNKTHIFQSMKEKPFPDNLCPILSILL